MSMLKDFVDRLVELAKVETLTFDDRKYTTKGIAPVLDPQPSPLRVESLTGLEDYIARKVVKEFYADDVLLHVVGYDSVRLIGGLSKPWCMRDCFIEAFIKHNLFPFGRFMDHEDFIIELQSKFVQDENTAAILKIVGNITDTSVTTFADDGITQQVTAKTGIAKIESVAIPNPVLLRPYRTFLEIGQPTSPFVFRMKAQIDDVPLAGLFTADGGMWKYEAMKDIKAWLNTNIPDVAVIA